MLFCLIAVVLYEVGKLGQESLITIKVCQCLLLLTGSRNQIQHLSILSPWSTIRTHDYTNTLHVSVVVGNTSPTYVQTVDLVNTF